ncbi:unnamed protein product [Symbiodinium natans]|uniref:Uncharacterized protein n=1 Tax=Symbiodinium natans TaxID=878477 RepID=A0A812QNQ9_9DINO|nr:unnamed protein product [Symbiodinium natans]
MKLRRHAKRFHHSPCPARVVKWYAKHAVKFRQKAAGQHAAHVAAWIAFGPISRLPKVPEIELLTKLLQKLRSGELPPRLQQVLPKVQAVLQVMRTPSKPWHQATGCLRRELHKLRCCHTRLAGDHDVMSGAPLAPEAADVESERTAEATSSPNAKKRLERKVEEWAGKRPAARLACLQQAKRVVQLEEDLNQKDLAEVMLTLAAALSNPQRHEVRAEAQVGSAAGRASPQEFQRRVRRLLLVALRSWQSNGYDCEEIRHILTHLQQKISAFEAAVGDVSAAASGSVWLAIKTVLGELRADRSSLQGSSPKSRACGWAGPRMAAGTKKLALQAAMTALGGRATLRQLVRFIRRNSDKFHAIDVDKLRKSGLSDYFQLVGRSRSGRDIFGLAQERPRGVRLLKYGFVALMEVKRLSCKCIGPLRDSAVQAHKDFLGTL